MGNSELNNIRVLISGGGTGGHVYPALAIADEIRRQYPDSAIHFVGANGKMEMEKMPQHGYTIDGIDISGIDRNNKLKNLSLPFKLLKSYLKVRTIIKNFKPQAVVGVGGYASGPLIFMATRRGIPGLIQEQNSYPGITNKVLAKHVKTICVAYPEMVNYFPKNKLAVTGNPVRDFSKVNEIPKEEAANFFGLDKTKPTLLIIGGSLGARTINEAVQQNLYDLLNNGCQILWQTGKFYFEPIKEKVKDVSGVKALAFIERMDYAYALADVVLSRAGAISISELALAAKAVILVPSPNVAEDHQTKNAMVLAKEGAAILVKDTEIKSSLVTEVTTIINDKNKHEGLVHAIKKFAKPDAAKDIVKELINLIHIN
ncbi:MAG: undecaprenyldiphospho-muramoylpentapeptide beta-N-acetylglucosaminyltransferase [Bacteroidetes bacterium]|nr:undecaprenyldiphospho-muramoylpentapeptide beta-N-acetylglucosaminyltransferase [Bacteroidota bacterium]